MENSIDLSAFDTGNFLQDPVDDPIEPTLPDDPVDPTEPSVDPVDPEEPDEPVESTEPDEPVDEPDDEGNKLKLVYSKIANLLKEEGLFDDEVKLDEVVSSDKLVDALRGEIKKNELADLNDTQKEYLKAVRDGVPDTMFAQHQKSVDAYTSITESQIAENEELRKNIILADLTAKGISEKRAEALYKTLSDSGEDIAEAVTSLNSLKESENLRYQGEVDKIKAANDAAALEEKDRFKQLKNRVYETKEIIKNYKITDKLRDSVYNTMTKGVAYGEDGRPISKFTKERDKDPVGFDTKLYYLFEMTKGFKDFTLFEKKAQSKASRELERIVQDTNIMKMSGKPNVPDVNQSDIPQIIELSD